MKIKAIFFDEQCFPFEVSTLLVSCGAFVGPGVTGWAPASQARVIRFKSCFHVGSIMHCLSTKSQSAVWSNGMILA